MKGFVAIGLLALSCGGASAPPARPAAPASDQVGGCWRDPGEGTVLCLENRGYVLLLPDGKWDRVAVDWAELTPTKRSGRTRTPRPLWLSVEVVSGALLMDDGQSKTRLARPEKAEEIAGIERRVKALPQIQTACAHAERCQKQSSMPASDLDDPRACIAYLNAVASVLRKAGSEVPRDCVP